MSVVCPLALVLAVAGAQACGGPQESTMTSSNEQESNAVAQPDAAGTRALCVDKACFDHVKIKLELGDLADALEDYEFNVRADAALYSCHGAIERHRGARLDCEPSLSASVTPEAECVDPGTGEKPRDCDISDRWALFVVFSDAPEEVALEITRDGKSIFERSGAPSYSIVHPSGPQCPQSCQIGALQL